jgi:predicted dinucleotide-binding enzyme
MRIGIIGAGQVGVALGTHWIEKGHNVLYSSRNPDPKNPRSATVAATAAHGEVVVLSMPWKGMREAVAACGDLSGKVVIDCLNPVLPDLSGLEIGRDTSAAELVASLAPGARVVKAFNTIGANVMANPDFGGRPATLLYCGDDAEAKRITAELARDVGFDPVDAGPLKQARVLEPFAMLWISLAFGGVGREFVFQLTRR